MKVIDHGHKYNVESLDGVYPQTIQFVKREGEKYPGNIGHHPGTTFQELCRIMINRAYYVNAQIQSVHTERFIDLQREAIRELERRAALMHGRNLGFVRNDIENDPTCKICGHIKCGETCR